MKTHWPLLIALLFLQRPAHSQTPSDHWIFRLSTGFGLLAPEQREHATMENFNYTAVDNATGAVSTQKFASTVAGHFPASESLLDLLDFEWTKKHNAINFGFGRDEQEANKFGGYFRMGYSYVFPLGKLSLKTGLDVGYIASKDAQLGTISDSNRYVVLPGNVITHQQYSVLQDNYGDGGDYVTLYSDHVDISYVRTAVFAQPRLVLSAPLSPRVTVGLEAGWLLQIHQYTYLQYVENDQSGSVSSVIGHYNLPGNGSFNGPYGMLHVGIRFKS